MKVPCVTCSGPTLRVRDGCANQTFLMSLAEIDGWGLSPRGAGFLFGGDVVDQVLACVSK